jgi:hypothetical protein
MATSLEFASVESLVGMYQFHFSAVLARGEEREEREGAEVSHKSPKPWTNPVAPLPLVDLAHTMSGSLPTHPPPNIPHLPERPVPSELLLVPVAPRGGQPTPVRRRSDSTIRRRCCRR